jgi:hypothetical protein
VSSPLLPFVISTALTAAFSVDACTGRSYIRQLKVEYDMFFGGGRKRPPAEIVWRIELSLFRFRPARNWIERIEICTRFICVCIQRMKFGAGIRTSFLQIKRKFKYGAE